MQLDLDRIVIERLRVHGSRDPLRDRLHIESWLGAIDLEPPTLPRHAVFVVRRVSTTLDGGLRGLLDPGELRASERALQGYLGRLADRAPRPALEAVPASAAAVLFRDRAEWLACLMRDALEGRLGEHWWWSAVLRRAPARTALLQAWQAAPEYLPAAIQELASSGHAANIGEIVHTEAARGLLLAIAERHGLTRLSALDGPRSVSSTKNAGPALPSGSDSPFGAGRGDPDAAGPEFAAAPSELPPRDADARALVGVALTLSRTPLAARSELFQQRVLEWLGRARAETFPARAEPALPALPPAAPPAPVAAPPSNPRPRQNRAPNVRVLAARSDPDPDPQSSKRPHARRAQAFDEGTSHDPTSEPAQRVESPSTPAATSVRLESELALDQAESRAAVTPSSALGRSELGQPTDSGPGTELEFRTQLGGLFFLVLVGVRLGLYGDFSTPRAPGIALSPWDYVELVGRALLPEHAFTDDPIWRCLATLAGRDSMTSAGTAFSPPDVFRIPDGWLEPFGASSSLHYRVLEGRLVVTHPAGFVVLDVPETTDLDAQLRAELAPGWGALGRELAGPGSVHAQAPLERWTGWIAPYVRARVALALGVSGESVAALLFERPARVRVTATHIEVGMALAQHPIELRRAGIDRDVGWLPAASKYLHFRFEELWP